MNYKMGRKKLKTSSTRVTRSAEQTKSNDVCSPSSNAATNCPQQNADPVDVDPPKANQDDDHDVILDDEEKEKLNAVMRQALENPLILLKSFRNFDNDDLLCSRLVSKKWNQLATQTILERQCFRLNFQYESDKYILTSLNETLEKSINFPCTSFMFDLDTDVEKELTTFFEIYGSHISSLDLVVHFRDEVSTRMFWKVLSTWTPNLKHLRYQCQYSYSVDDQQGPAVEDQDEDPKLSLPVLETFSGEEEIWDLKILNAASNLKTIEHFNLPNNVNAVHKSAKILLVKKLKFDVMTHQGEVQLSKFLDCHPQLTWLKLNFGRGYSVCEPEKVEPFQRLLDSNANFLEYLNLGRLCTDYPQIRLPKFVKLKELKLKIATTYEKFMRKKSTCFPQTINLAWTFPNLETLDMSRLRMDDDNNWGKYFHHPSASSSDDCSSELLTSVRHIVVNQRITETWMSRILTNLCPAFTRLTMWNHSKNPHVVLKKIFKQWQHLEHIEFLLIPLFHEIDNLDSVLTGFTAKTCSTLLQSLSSSSVDSDMEKLIEKELSKRRPALWNMTELKQLKFTVTDPRTRKLHVWIPDPKPFEYKADQSRHTILSFVSEKYGFNLVPYMKFVVQYNPLYEPEEMASELIAVHPNVHVVQQTLWKYPKRL